MFVSEVLQRVEISHFCNIYFVILQFEDLMRPVVMAIFSILM